MAKHSGGRKAGSKPDAQESKKCLGYSAERTERIKDPAAILALVTVILGLIANLLLFGRAIVEARNQQVPPAAPIQATIQCSPVISITVPAPKKVR